MHATIQNGGARNRLDENKGTFGPFVAGQKDEENSYLHADSQFEFYMRPYCLKKKIARVNTPAITTPLYVMVYICSFKVLPYCKESGVEPSFKNMRRSRNFDALAFTPLCIMDYP
ncbi:hypothetical protein [Edaphocola aurantiacus]|uniref:hypothetical protein n=1 Tax=Edaphocola aurantiacus TaxID=2601682 RepID=UPI001C94876B|nr:hypothetical protein [Edaphocola aurantiacus]